MTKAYGKSNLLFFHNFTTYWPRSKRNILSINSVFLNGKTEFDKNKFDFTNNDSIFYGNFGKVEDDDFNNTSFQGQNTSIFVKNKNDTISAAFYRDYIDEIQLRKVVKIVNNFMKNNIVYINVMETIDEKDENNFLDNIDEWFEKCDNWEKQEINIKEFIIYQIEI